MNYFWVLWSFDALIALVIVYFLIIGLSDGSVSSQNIRLWLLIMAGLVVILGGSLWLKSCDKMAMAKTLLYVLAIPGLVYALFLLLMIFGKPRWN